jgi:succinate dehydrogenase / fumarate reductase membrane anchor subunit
MSTYGSKRLVVGAHYGFRDWLAQRVTAAVMALYTLVLLLAYLFSKGVSYEKWAGLFSHQWMKLLTLVAIVSMAYHAWVGVRDIWMDYVKPVALRLVLQAASVLWLVAMAGWAIQVLWRV